MKNYWLDKKRIKKEIRQQHWQTDFLQQLAEQKTNRHEFQGFKGFENLRLIVNGKLIEAVKVFGKSGGK